LPNPVDRENSTVISLHRTISDHEQRLRRIVTLVRGDDDSYENAINGFIHDFTSGGSVGRPSLFPRLVAGNMAQGFTTDALSASFDDILRENRDLFWLQDLADGGFVAHTPQGRMIIGADKSSFDKEEINSAMFAIFAVSSGMRIKGPVLGQLDHSAVIDGGIYPFDDDAMTSDGSFRVERLNNYEVMIEGYRDKRWRVSLLDQFIKELGRISEAEEYMQTWEGLSHDLYFLAEKLWIKLQRVSERPEEIAGSDGYSPSIVESISQTARPLKRLFSAFPAFKENQSLRGSWERTFVTGLIEHMADRFPWLDLVGDRSKEGNVVRLGKILGGSDAASECRDIYCPLSLMKAFGADREARRWLNIEVNAPEELRIISSRNRPLQRLISALIFSLGASHRYDSSSPTTAALPSEPTHVSVEWIENEKGLLVRDLTKSRSAFAALDPNSKGREDLDRLASGIGGTIDYRWKSLAITIPEAPPPIGGAAVLGRIALRPPLLR